MHGNCICDNLVDHQCPVHGEQKESAEHCSSEWREALEWALGLEADVQNHTPEWARELIREIREIGNRK